MKQHAVILYVEKNATRYETVIFGYETVILQTQPSRNGKITVILENVTVTKKHNRYFW